jgi:Domain of unknown function (DUF1707)
VTTLLVSDQEREYTVSLLRTHLLTGRLTQDEFEERVDEAWRARFAEDLWHALRWLPVDAPPAAPPRPRGGGTAVASLILGACALCLLVTTLGFGSPLALALFATSWGLGREARRTGSPDVRREAVAAEVIGAGGTIVCVLLLASCAAVVL